MAFDLLRRETDITLTYNGIDYKVIDNSDSGLIIVAKKEDVDNKKYPLELFAIPDANDQF